jgi:acid stress chaperone HdeB
MKAVHAFAILAALAVAPALADETLPLATMTCKQFVESPKETIGVILTWIMGFTHDSDEPAEINFTKMEKVGRELGAYCGKNPSHGLMKAVEKVTE